MPDIVSFTPFANGTTPTPGQVNGLIYAPRVGSPESCEVINGQLGSSNVGEWLVNNEMVRSRSCYGGDMVGLTGNLDYTPPVFTDSYLDTDSYLAIPGASLSFYLPVKPKLTIITFQVGGANAIKFRTDEDGTDKTRLEFHLNGESKLGTRRISQSRHGDTLSEPHKALRRPHRDRVWSGHYLTDDLEAGWHNASCRVHNRKQTLRLRIRNMKVIWFT